MDNVELMNVAYKTILETFKIESLKPLQWEALGKLAYNPYTFGLHSQENLKQVVPECLIMNKDHKERDKPKHGAQETKAKLMPCLFQSDNCLWQCQQK